jgi:hypothetical protein
VEFTPDAEVHAELTRLVELERECCPFLDLQIEQSADALVLRASGPPEAQQILQDLLSPPTLP